MKILCVGDVVGKPGRNAIKELVPKLQKEYAIDFTIVNGENAAGGAGVTQSTAKMLLENGCDILTLGDHVWDQKDIEEYLSQQPRIIRPANFPEETPGQGYSILETRSGIRVGVINVLGRVFIRYNVDCPFKAAERLVSEIKKQTPIIIVDFHAEATSEKTAIGYFLDGKVSAVVGTHTHIQTADEKILVGGTAYITDLGMTGPCDSVIGQDKESIIKRFLTSMPIKFNVAEGDVRLHGVVIDVDENTGKALNIIRIQEILE